MLGLRVFTHSLRVVIFNLIMQALRPAYFYSVNRKSKMESRADYSHLDHIKVRQETLLPANRWTQPTPEEVSKVLSLAGLNGCGAAELLGLSIQGAGSSRSSRTLRRWTSGDTKIPYAPWAVLVHKAGFGIIWE